MGVFTQYYKHVSGTKSKLNSHRAGMTTQLTDPKAAAGAIVPKQVQQPAIGDETGSSKELLASAYKLLDEGDPRLAGEKGWLAFKRALRDVFVAYNVSDECLREHRDVIAFALFLSRIFDSSIHVLSCVASELHDNFYDGIYNEQWVRDSLGDVKELIGKLDNVKEACTKEDLQQFIAQHEQP